MRHLVIPPVETPDTASRVESNTHAFQEFCRQVEAMNRNGPYVAYQSSNGKRNICVLVSNSNERTYGFRCLIDIMHRASTFPGPGHLTYAGRTVEHAILNAMKYRDVYIFDDPVSLYIWIGEVGKNLLKGGKCI